MCLAMVEMQKSEQKTSTIQYATPQVGAVTGQVSFAAALMQGGQQYAD